MADVDETPFAILGALVAIFFVLATLVTLGAVTHRAVYGNRDEVRQEAVEHGYAHWVTAPDGTSTFHWNNESSTAAAVKP